MFLKKKNYLYLSSYLTEYLCEKCSPDTEQCIRRVYSIEGKLQTDGTRGTMLMSDHTCEGKNN